MDRQLFTGIIIYIITFIGIILADLLRKIIKKDPFNNIIFDIPFLSNLTNEKGYSCWPIFHFIMYVFLGFFAPKYWYIWLILGILWEVIEYYLGIIFGKDKEREENKSVQYTLWITGTYSDIIFNIIGLLFGVLLTKSLNK